MQLTRQDTFLPCRAQGCRKRRAKHPKASQALPPLSITTQAVPRSEVLDGCAHQGLKTATAALLRGATFTCQQQMQPRRAGRRSSQEPAIPNYSAPGAPFAAELDVRLQQMVLLGVW